MAQNNWEDNFDPKDYLQGEFSKDPADPENPRSHSLPYIHKAIQSNPELAGRESVSVLDYGCGPVICHVISALGLPNVSELVLAEYTARNRDFMRKWLEGDSSGFDWRPYFKHVVQTIEGGSESHVIEREAKVRQLAKLVECDIDSKDNIIEKGFEGPYDIVISFLAFDGDCQTIEEYNARITKLATLVKPGGTVLYQVPIDPDRKELLGTYPVGDKIINCIKLIDGESVDAMKKAGLEIISSESVYVGGLFDHTLKTIHAKRAC